MTTTARDLLIAIDPLPAPARQRHIATTARALVGSPELDALLDDLAGRDEFGRRLAVRMASIAGHRGHMERAWPRARRRSCGSRWVRRSA